MSFRKNILITVLAMGSFSALAQTNPAPIHPDLITNDVVDLGRIEDQVSEEIRRLSSTSFITMDVGVPDYKVANYHLQAKITHALAKFFKRMDALNIRLKTDLSRIKSVDDVRAQYNSPEWQEAYDLEVMKVYPQIASYLNKEYQAGIRELYSLDNFLDLAVAKGRKADTNIFKEKVASINRLNSGCVTKMCLSKINEDVNEWIRLVDAIDTGIQLGKGKTITERAGLNKKVNRFSIAIADFMKQTIKVGLEENKVYTNGSALADYAESIGKSSIGVSAGILYLPALILDKVVNFTQGLSPSKKFIFTNLKANKVATYEIEDAINDRNILVEKERQSLRNVAVGESEIKEVLVLVLRSTAIEKTFILEMTKSDKGLLEMLTKYAPEYLMPLAKFECLGLDNFLRQCNAGKQKLSQALKDSNLDRFATIYATDENNDEYQRVLNNGQIELGVRWDLSIEKMTERLKAAVQRNK